MIAFVLRRLVAMSLSIIVVSIVIFVMMHSIPGGPFDAQKMPLSKEVKEKLRARYGLDRPLYIQYLRYIWNALHFNFGRSYQSPGETVSELIGRTWPKSAFLAGIGLLIAIPAGISMGIVGATKQNSLLDYLTTSISTLGLTLPVYILAMVLILIFAIWLHWLPAGGWGAPSHFVLPILAYSLMPFSIVARYTRSSLLEALNEQYIWTARAKGVPERSVVFKHGLRNALVPLLTVTMPMFAGLMTGTIFVEKMFRIPGLGRYFVSSITSRDYPLMMALILILTVLFGVTYIVTDILYCVVDPRVRLEDREE